MSTIVSFIVALTGLIKVISQGLVVMRQYVRDKDVRTAFEELHEAQNGDEKAAAASRIASLVYRV